MAPKCMSPWPAMVSSPDSANQTHITTTYPSYHQYSFLTPEPRTLIYITLVSLSLWHVFTLIRDYKDYVHFTGSLHEPSNSDLISEAEPNPSTSPSATAREIEDHRMQLHLLNVQNRTRLYLRNQYLTSILSAPYPTKTWICSKICALVAVGHSSFLLAKRDGPVQLDSSVDLVPLGVFVVTFAVFLLVAPRIGEAACETCMAISERVALRRLLVRVACIGVGCWGMLFYGARLEVQPLELVRVLPAFWFGAVLVAAGVFRRFVMGWIEGVAEEYADLMFTDVASELRRKVKCGCFQESGIMGVQDGARGLQMAYTDEKCTHEG